MIRFDSVGYTYPGAGAPALAALDFSLAPGEMVVLLGANGSGKSTLARLTNGLLLPASGSVTVDGASTQDASTIYDIRTRVGMVFQRPDDQIVATSVEDDVAFGPENIGLAPDEIRARVDEALAQTGLVGLEDREPHLLSGGQKQRLAVAGALAMRPRYLVADEPTSMIDPVGRREVLDLLERVRSAGYGVLLITHSVADARSADRVVVLSRGESAFEGSYVELVRDPAWLAEWGLEVPRIVEFGSKLRAQGVAAPGPRSIPQEMAVALWR
ncbi:MAG: ATP-binding cassette domain-containing protein [Coriobacteriia bacterium]|nr:ATP-binding cassette domain-containing protein [Coriobacteriia bacterium]